MYSDVNGPGGPVKFNLASKFPQSLSCLLGSGTNTRAWSTVFMQESMALFTALNIFTEPLELQQDITSLVSLSSDYSYTERLNFKKKKL
ncbi:hypothetical protein BofuT4_uP072570.1 [Botrytis cinerea T4]|uniref:Uncharacterized protein n=1 Tax=Botryotinia fuckeliana (strain T4) TaxID=999810 RepID=G2XPN4_BOTF4|nr:hypothetical protein BofuT4_uP072570.1 [Botrytis cinerea T4]